jgi:predicted amidophosphoribosyltransferase
MAKTMNKPILPDLLYRAIENPTQTRKGVYERWENVAGIFEYNHSEPVENKHILIVDDVLTTGSTFEACVLPLQKIAGIKISIAALAAAV